MSSQRTYAACPWERGAFISSTRRVYLIVAHIEFAVNPAQPQKEASTTIQANQQANQLTNKPTNKQPCLTNCNSGHPICVYESEVNRKER